MPNLASAHHGDLLTADDTEPRVIELAWPHPEGGMDPEQPLILAPVQVTGRVLTGHTADAADRDAPIIVRQGDITGPGGARVAEGRCPSCAASVTMAAGDAETLMIIEHAADCAAFRALLREAGR